MNTEEKLKIATEALGQIGYPRMTAPEMLGFAVSALTKIRPFRVDRPGRYRTRNGGEFTVLCTRAPGSQPVVGYWVSDGESSSREYSLDGHYMKDRESYADLVEFIE